MSEREPITESVVQRLLIGVTSQPWRAAPNGIRAGRQIVADFVGVIGGMRTAENAALVERAPEIAEWGVRQARRVAELEAQVARLRADYDAATRTDDEEEEPTFATEMADSTKDL